EPLAGAKQQRVRLLTRGVEPMRVGVVVEQVVGHGVDDGQRNLGPARTVEVRDGLTVVNPLESGELAANCVDGGDGFGCRALRCCRRCHAISTPAHCSTNLAAST